MVIDGLIGKRQIWVWRTDCQFQMVPWGRTGGDTGISAPERPQAVSYMHQALLRRGKAEAKKERRSHSSWLYGFHSIFISPLPIGRIFPGALASTYNSPSVYTSPRVLDALEGKTNGLHDSISIFFFPQAPFFQSSFLFFFWKKFICCQRESVVFVINVVEIQICPPRKGVFINSYSPEN